MLFWMPPSPRNQKGKQTSNEGGWVLRSGRGRLRGTKSTSAAPPAATNRSTFSRQHRPKDLGILQCEFHFIEVKCCENTRLHNQLSTAQEQHKGLCSILQGASVTLHTTLMGVGGIIYNNHTLEPWKVLGLDLKELRNFLLNFMFILSITLPNLSIPDVPFPTLINSHQETVSGQACNPPDPHWYLPFSYGGGVLQYPVPKWLLLLNWCGEWFFTACVVFRYRTDTLYTTRHAERHTNAPDPALCPLCGMPDYIMHHSHVDTYEQDVHQPPSRPSLAVPTQVKLKEHYIMHHSHVDT